MTPGVRRAAALVVTALLGLATAACGGGDESAPTSPVALRLGAAPQDIRIGVVVSLTSDPGQGAEWSQAAEGAAVAGYRYRLGGLDVRIVPVNDRGTSQGGASAVKELVAKHVSGIVLATEGSHVAGALSVAQTAGVPVLMPYATSRADLPGDAWLTGPDSASIGSALTRALAGQSATRPLLVDAGGGTPDGLEASRRIGFATSGDPTALVSRIARLVRGGAGIDAIVVSGPARVQADVVVALQGADLGVPTLLTPQALSPVFATELDAQGGSLDTPLTTVGLLGGDNTALQSGTEGATASAFLAALRAAAQDPKLEDYFDDRPFAVVAGSADTRSHDAVVALVDAAADAGSAEPVAVAKALDGLRVTHGEGLGGPDLHFVDHTAIDPSQVVVLQATSQDTGLRPGTSGSPRLSWFSGAR